MQKIHTNAQIIKLKILRSVYLVKLFNISLIRIAIVLSIENTLRSKERLIQHNVKYLSNYHNMVMLSCVHISFQNRIILNKNNMSHYRMG